MQKAPIPSFEKDRMKAVEALHILDTKPEERFDLITKEAVSRLRVPISTISIIDSNREWYKSCQGLNDQEGDRAISFCGHSLLAKDLFIVQDTLEDERFKDNPMVIGSPYIRFYAGIALLDHKTGQPVGVFCVKDTKPRRLSVREIDTMLDLAERAEKELNK